VWSCTEPSSCHAALGVLCSRCHSQRRAAHRSKGKRLWALGRSKGVRGRLRRRCGALSPDSPHHPSPFAARPRGQRQNRQGVACERGQEGGGSSTATCRPAPGGLLRPCWANRLCHARAAVARVAPDERERERGTRGSQRVKECGGVGGLREDITHRRVCVSCGVGCGERRRGERASVR